MQASLSDFLQNFGMEHANGPVQGIQQRCFSEAGPDCVVHFQIVQLRRQLFVWLSVGSAALGTLCLASRTRMVLRKLTLLVCKTSSVPVSL